MEEIEGRKSSRRSGYSPTTPLFKRPTSRVGLSSDEKIVFRDSPAVKRIKASGNDKNEVMQDIEGFVQRLAHLSPEGQSRTTSIATTVAIPISYNPKTPPQPHGTKRASDASHHNEILNLLEKMDADYSQNDTQSQSEFNTPIRRPLINTITPHQHLAPVPELVPSTTTCVMPVKVVPATPTPVTTKLPLDDDLFDDGFEFEDIDCDFLEQQAIATLTQQKQDIFSGAVHGFLRCKVIEINSFPSQRQLQINVRNETGPGEDDTNSFWCCLCEDWFDTPLQVGFMVNIIKHENAEETHSTTTNVGDMLMINNSQHMITVEPDILVTPTMVTSSFRCVRRAILQSVLPLDGEKSSKALVGTLKHELFEQALVYRQWSTPFLIEATQTILKNHIEALLECKLSEHEALSLVEPVYSDIATWMISFLGVNEHSKKVSKSNVVRMSSGSRDDTSEHITVHELIATEDMIWSTKWGLKGATDATVCASVGKNAPTILPLELKTGNRAFSEVEHRGQVMLYTLLLKERYQHMKTSASNSGLLIYFPGPQTEGVVASELYARALVQARNRIAVHLRPFHFQGKASLLNHNETFLPPMLNSAFECSKCFQKRECLLYRASSENESEIKLEPAIEQIASEQLGHLSTSHLAYFNHWNRLLDVEKRHATKSMRNMWLKSVDARELDGHTLGSLVLHDMKVDASTVLVHFTRPSRPDDMDTTPFTNGDPVIVSIGSEQSVILHVCRGEIVKMTSNDVSVSIRISVYEALKKHSVSQKCWRLDKDIFFSAMNRSKSNLIKLFVGSNAVTLDTIGVHATRTRLVKIPQTNPDATIIGDHLRLRSIVELQAPRFHKAPMNIIKNNAALRKTFLDLNADQQNALLKITSALDYALILGMPGTGKTWTIAVTVQILVALGYTVLLSSYTHSALDNLLMKLAEMNVSFLRLGNAKRVHPSLHKFTLSAKEITSTQRMKNLLLSAKVVATSCLGTNHVLFRLRRFDYCIVDEAGQITQPAILGPLRSADTFVLVGDHYQLPPLVVDEEAKANGLDESLFKRLADAHPSAIVALTHQYRMSANIMALSNELVYSKKLKCGSHAVAQQKILYRNLNAKEHMTTWMQYAIDPLRTVLFINTDEISTSLEERIHGAIVNRVEAYIIVSILQTLTTWGGLDGTNLGVIAPYRSQVRTVKTLLEKTTLNGISASTSTTGIEVATVDKYQGKDKDVVLLSLVRSNVDRHMGELWSDERRVNVALTRAKQKLILVGSGKTIQGSPILTSLWSMIQRNQWHVNVPAAHIPATYIPKTLYSSCSLHPMLPKTKTNTDKSSILDIENLVPVVDVYQRTTTNNRRQKEQHRLK